MLAKVFGDGMVLQADEPVCLWGRSEPGRRLTLSLTSGECRRRQEVLCGSDGRFSLEFPPMPASRAEFFLLVAGEGVRQEVRRVRFGQVFLLAGQSNMELPARYVEPYDPCLDDCRNEAIALLKLGNAFPSARGPAFDERPMVPLEDICPRFVWRTAEPESVAEFSALGWFFAARLQERLGVPVGVVDTSVGACGIAAYLPRAVIERDRPLSRSLAARGLSLDPADWNRRGEGNFTQPSGIFNEKIAPLGRLKFRAVVWYQGESELLMGGGPDRYGRWLERLIVALRAHFGQPVLPFFCFGIAHNLYAQPLAAVRFNGMLADVCGRTPRCRFVPTYDIFADYLAEDGQLCWHPLHPVAKRAPGERLAEMVLPLCEGREPLAAPCVKKIFKGKGRVRLRFSTTYGLRAVGGRPAGFYVLDAAGRLFPARAQLAGRDAVVLTDFGLERPAGVGYADFTDNGFCNLTSREGIPALPFRNGGGRARQAPPVPFFCAAEEVVSPCYWPYSGGHDRKPAWKNGELFSSSRVRLRLAGGRPKLAFAADNAAYFFFGLSPERIVNVDGAALDLSRYGALSLTLRTSTGLQCCGLHLCTAEGRFVHCPPVGAGAEGWVKLERGKSTVVVPLRPLSCLNEPLPVAVLTRPRALQFTFRSLVPGKLVLEFVGLRP